MTQPAVLNFFATSPKGLELLLVDELRSLGAENVAEKLAGVTFSGDLGVAYRACLWSRLANRILLPLARIKAASPDELYQGVQTIDWNEHLAPEGTLAVQVVCSKSNIDHSLFAAQKVKDAIVDQFRQKFGVRPSVARNQPQLALHVYLHRNEATISLDLSGESLHKRGYRLEGGIAPLKENLAAAILLRAKWPEIAKQGGTLLDPMCGSGTLLIEAALMAAEIAPGLLRHYFGFLGWKKHQAALWDNLMADARKKRERVTDIATIIGYDQDKTAIKIAFENIERAGLRGKIHVEKRDLAVFGPKLNAKQGLVVVNPPYGERVGEVEELQPLYTLLGERLKQGFTGWRAAIFTGNPELGKQMGIRSKHYYSLFNGKLPCKLLLFEISPDYFIDRSPEADNERRIRTAKRAVSGEAQGAGEMFANRLRKKLKHLKKVIKKGGAACRVYDADLPDYAFAIDLTDCSAHVQEYKAPKMVSAQKVARRRNEVLALLPELLNLPPRQIFFSEIEFKPK